MIYFYTSRKPLFIYLFIFGLEKVSQTHSFEKVSQLATKYQDKRHLRILLTKRVSGNNQ